MLAKISHKIYLNTFARYTSIQVSPGKFHLNAETSRLIPSQYGNLQAKFHYTKPGILPAPNINCTHLPPLAPGPIHTKHTVHTIQVPYRITSSNNNIIYQTYSTYTGSMYQIYSTYTGRVDTNHTQHTQREYHTNKYNT